MEMRTLKPSERESLLELLDGWDVGDGWRGGDFFRRYLEDDPTFRCENVFVAVDGGRPVSCVQVFPRPLGTPQGTLPMGGIGSVYTDPAFRKRGLAEGLLARAVEGMREGGMLVSMLFTGRRPWYARLGWRSHGVRRALVQRSSDPGAPFPGIEEEVFEPSRDLGEVRSLHEGYSGLLTGPVVRDDALWEGSLRNAGNPDEEFLLARKGGVLVAYLRGVVLSGILCGMEFAHAPGFEGALAELFVRLSEPRADDAWARPERPSRELRRVLTTQDLGFAPDLAVELAKRGFEVSHLDDPTLMTRCLDAEAVCARLGLAPRSGESPDELLARVLPPEDLLFWTADRF